MNGNNNKLVLYIIIIILIGLAFFEIFNTLDSVNSLKKNKWYNVEDTGNITVLDLKNGFKYYDKKTNNPIKNYRNCKKYTYTISNKTLNLKCPVGFKNNRQIKIIEQHKNFLVLEINDEKKKFYLNIKKGE
ncbi:MAG: hypothetical protein RSE48_00295 [Bacilli bacterium]